MDLHPVTPRPPPRRAPRARRRPRGPRRRHGRHVWSVGHDMARALRRSRLRCAGINVLVCDGEVAFQTVFHFHLHVIPATPGTAGPSRPSRRPRAVASRP
ncbi:HIT domain-containing protein [Amycolatopsis tolypomycina]|uniref:HIT domain-containing protein n=1 Tax=Amycolatopsis tolypomycina TaxID=208445 RepID=UPI003CC5B6AF